MKNCIIVYEIADEINCEKLRDAAADLIATRWVSLKLFITLVCEM